MPFQERKKLIVSTLADRFRSAGIDATLLDAEVATPPNPTLGYIAIPCFRLAKKAGEANDVFAKKVAEAVNQIPDTTATVAGPYVNIKWKAALLCRETLQKIASESDRYGTDTSGQGKTIVLEYCSPNIAKKLAFQHIRSTLIGNVLANVYANLGFTVQRINFVGDWGTQFSGLLAALSLWGSAENVRSEDPSGSMKYLLDLYVRFNDELAKEASHRELAAAWLQKLENGDAAATALWKQIREVSLSSMQATLKRLGIQFDLEEGESKYVSRMPQVLEDVKQKAQARISEGAWIVEIEGINTPALIQKRDGTTLYLTRDIAAAIDRFERLNFARMFYVVSEQQKLHFQLLFAVLKKMGLEWGDRCAHLSFGTVFLNSEKMSTRRGTVIFLDDLLDEAHRLALQECTAKNPELQNKENVAEMVGIAGIIFGALSTHRNREINFDWQQVLALEGETGPYVQYSLVRCHSLLRKAAERGEVIDASAVSLDYAFAPEEEALLLDLAKFRETLHIVTRDQEPYHLTHYLIDLAKSFNRFYYQLPVLQNSDAAQRKLRLQLVQATRQVLANGLKLLGIQAPTEM